MKPIHLHLCLKWRQSSLRFMFQTVAWHTKLLLYELQHLQWLWNNTVRSTTVKQNLKAVTLYSFNSADLECSLLLYVQCNENTVFRVVWKSYLHGSLMFVFQCLNNTAIPRKTKQNSTRLIFLLINTCSRKAWNV